MEIGFLTLKVADKTVNFPACFSLEAAGALESEYGSLKEWGNRLAEGQIAVIAFTVNVLIGEGFAVCEDMGIECPPRPKCKPSKLISPADKQVITDIFKVVKNDMERTVEVASKN